MHLVELASRQHAVGPHPNQRGHVLRDRFAVPRDDLHGHTQLRERVDGRCGVVFGLVEKRQETFERQVGLVGARIGGSSVYRSRRHGQHANSLAAPRLIALFERRSCAGIQRASTAELGADLEDVMKRPFRDAKPEHF